MKTVFVCLAAVAAFGLSACERKQPPAVEEPPVLVVPIPTPVPAEPPVIVVPTPADPASEPASAP